MGFFRNPIAPNSERSGIPLVLPSRAPTKPLPGTVTQKLSMDVLPWLHSLVGGLWVLAPVSPENSLMALTSPLSHRVDLRPGMPRQDGARLRCFFSLDSLSSMMRSSTPHVERI